MRRECGILCVYQMKASLHASIAPGKRFAAFVCLLAAVMLWAPLWATALQANGMACCDGVMCAAHGHSAMEHGGGQAAQTEQPMQCGHSGGGSMMNCGMACCHEQAHHFVASIQFLLPVPVVISQPQQAAPSALARDFAEILPSFDPLSPPPRTLSL